MLLELLVNGLIFGSKVGLWGLGFAIIFYTTKEFHFAYGTVLITSGYLGYVFMNSWGLPAALAVIMAVGLVMLLGMALQYWLYRPLGDHLAIMLMALGCSVVLENVLHMVFGVHDKMIVSRVLSSIVQIGGIRIRVVEFVIAGTFLLVWLLVYYVLHKRKIGLALRAVMKDPEMSELIGIKSRFIKVFAYAVGSGIAALAGVLMVVDTGIRPGLGFEVLVFAFIVTIIGGGNVHHVAGWGVFVGVMMNVSAWQLPTQFQTLIVFAFMLVYMLVRSRVSLGAEH